MRRRKRRYTEPIGLTLTKAQFKDLERLVKVMRLRSKQQVLRKLLNKARDEELGAF